MPDRLCSIGVKEDAVLPSNLSNFLNWLDGSDFVVRKHYRDQNRIVRDRSLHIAGVNSAIVISLQDSSLEAPACQMVKRVEYGSVFDRGCNEMVTPVTIRFCNTYQSDIV